MFTGIIEEIGTVRAMNAGVNGAAIDIEAHKVLEGTSGGDSIAVNGVCLTVSPFRGHFRADVMPETLRRTSLGSLRPGSKVNLERAMPCGGRFGGHIVTGHVDVCGHVASVIGDGIARILKVSVPPDAMKYIAVKGSITLDGTSLTVSATGPDSLSVSLIPHTMASTTLGLLKAGDRVNVEVDLLARYLEKLMSAPAGGTLPDSMEKPSGGGLTVEFLKENGF